MVDEMFAPSRAIGRALLWFGSILAVWLLVIAAGVRGPVIEAHFLPVWSAMTVEWEPATPRGMKANLYGHKDRGECRLLEITAMVRDRSVWHLSPFTVDGRQQLNRSRPEGWQSLGLWSLDRAGDRLRLTAHYSCHDLWDTPAMLGEWASPGAAQQ